MRDRHIFPRKDYEFNEYISVAIIYLINHQLRLRITNDNLDEAVNIVIDWIENWTKYTNPNLNTTVVGKDKVTLRGKLEHCFRTIYHDIPASVFTIEDHITLNIKGQGKGKGKIFEIVTFAPIMLLEKNNHLQQVMRFKNPDTPDSDEMPEGHWIFRESYIGAAGMKSADIPFANGRNVSKRLNSITFEDKDTGKSCYTRCYYENNAGKRGPVSLTVEVVIW